MQTIATVGLGAVAIGRPLASVLRRRKSQLAEPIFLSSSLLFRVVLGTLLVPFAVGFGRHGGAIGIVGAILFGIVALISFVMGGVLAWAVFHPSWQQRN